MAEYDIKYSQNFSRNVVSNIINLIINILVGLLLVPFFLDTLGPAAYALIPLATSITSYVILFVDVINTAIARYLTIELQKGELKKANETYSTSFFFLLGIVIVLIPVILLLSYLAPNFFETGQISHDTVFIFFSLILGSVLLTALKSNFMVTLFAFNRLDLRNYVTIIQTITQISLIIFLFMIIGPTLPFVGISYLVASIISFILAYYYAKKINSNLVISPSNFNKSRIRELSGLSFFVFIDRMGCILQTQIALIILNIYFGAVIQAQYSLVLTWISFLLSLSSIITNTIAPKVYSLAGLGDNNGIVHFVSIFTKFTGYLMALPLTLLCIFSSQLMTLWVGPEYVTLVPLVWILLPAYYFTITLSCQVSIAISHNRMKFPALLNISGGILYLSLALTLPVLFNIGYYGVAIASVITIFLLHGIIAPIFYSHVLKAPRLVFIKNMFPGFIAMIILMLAGYTYTLIVDVNSLLMLILSVSVISIVYLGILLKFIISKSEKKLIIKCLPNCLQNSKIIMKL